MIIIRTLTGCPGERAGLQRADAATGIIGDVIVTADGKPVRQLSDLTGALEGKQIPGKIELTSERS